MTSLEKVTLCFKRVTISESKKDKYFRELLMELNTGTNELKRYNIPYERSFASYEKSKCWDFDKNEDTPRDIKINLNKKRWFLCDKCTHSFDFKINDIFRGRWCGYCAGKRICSKEQNCTICIAKSCADNPKMLKYWSSKNEKPAEEVYKNSCNNVLFNCEKCTHEFCSCPSNVTSGTWCGYCDSKKICKKEKQCSICISKSCASNKKIKDCWSSNNNFPPEEVYLSSNKKILLNCIVCKHEFDILPYSIKNINSWCGYCSSRKLCKKEKQCSICIAKSCASNSRMLKCWSSKNELLPEEVYLNCHNKILFNCDKCGNDFSTKPNSITSGGNWCPFCKHKTEQKFYDIFSKFHKSLIREVKFEWCKNTTYLPFDFLIPNFRIIIEIDGPQHFLQVSNWKSPELTQEGDIYKMNCANSKGYSIIRIIQDDILKDKYDWVIELKCNIFKIIIEGKQNIFMCKNNEYLGWNHAI